MGNNKPRSVAKKVGIIICDRYRSCAGGKCFRSLTEREGAFSRYDGQDVELVTWDAARGQADLMGLLADETVRLAYD